MEDLIQNFSVHEIFLFTIFLACGFKATVKFIEWLNKKIKKWAKKEKTAKKLRKKIKKFKSCQRDSKMEIENFRQELDKLSEIVHRNNGRIDTLSNNIQSLQDNISNLKSSNEDLIKDYIINVHTQSMNRGWISGYDLDICEKRYKEYIGYGEDPFVEKLMNEIRALPSSLQEGGK